MHNRYHTTHFITSVRELSQLPPDRGREVAFSGRSNAGKSSALNAITGQKSLARISKLPGRTQMINFFQIDLDHRLVDLPGYGYAKVPEAMRRYWQTQLPHYLNVRKTLCGLFLLMDVRHPFTALDVQMLTWCQHRKLPSHILLTKADKLKRGVALTNLQQAKTLLGQQFPYASIQLFSALRGLGITEAHAKLDEWLGYSEAD
jgi:GTP-binding protein